MSLTTSRHGLRLVALMGSASLLTMANANPASAQGEVAQADEIPETVLITGSLIRGTAAVGVPVTNLSPMDFAMTGALTTADLFRTFPAANVAPGPVATMSGANIERGTKVNLRGLDTGNATRSLLMIDGMRFPGQGNGQCMIDPSIIPALSLDHIDVLVDGASATYGSDAIGGVINIILKRNMDGAITQVRWTDGRRRQEPLSRLGRVGPHLGRRPDHAELRVVRRIRRSTGTGTRSSARITGRGASTTGVRLGSSLPATLSTGAAARPGGGNVGTAAQLRALAARTAIRFRSASARTGIRVAPAPGPGQADRPAERQYHGLQSRLVGLQHIRESAGPTVSGTSSIRIDIAWYDARQERNGGAHHRRSAADEQHLVLRLGLLQHSPRSLPEPVEPEPVGDQRRHRRRSPDVQPLLPDRRRPDQSARLLQSRLGKPEHHDVLRARAALPARPQHRASRRLERPRLVLDDQGRELQPRQRHDEQERGLRGSWLDDRNGRPRREARPRSARGRSRPTFPT